MCEAGRRAVSLNLAVVKLTQASSASQASVQSSFPVRCGWSSTWRCYSPRARMSVCFLQVFFVIRLIAGPAANSLPPIVDPDPLIPCDLMDGRDAFLTLARDKHLEFSSLRRAQWSTMCMLVELHTQSQDRFVYTCNECKHHVETRWHCTVCEVGPALPPCCAPAELLAQLACPTSRVPWTAPRPSLVYAFAFQVELLDH